MVTFFVCGVNEAKVRVTKNKKRMNLALENIPLFRSWAMRLGDWPVDFDDRSIFSLKVDPVGNFAVQRPDLG